MGLLFQSNTRQLLLVVSGGKLIHCIWTTLAYDCIIFEVAAGASIPWGNEAEIFIIAILGGKFLKFFLGGKKFVGILGGKKCQCMKVWVIF